MTTGHTPAPQSGDDAFQSWFTEMRRIAGANGAEGSLVPVATGAGRTERGRSPAGNSPPDLRNGLKQPGMHDRAETELPGRLPEFVPNASSQAAPKSADRADLGAYAESPLTPMKEIVKGLISERFGLYASGLVQPMADYKTAADKETADKSETAHIALSLAFAFGGAIVGPAVAAAGAAAAEMLKDLPKFAPVVQRMQSALESDVAKKALDVGVEAMQTEMRKEIVAATKSVPQTMLNYVSLLHKNIRYAGDALYDSVHNETKPDGIAAVYAAMKAVTAQKFDAELKSHLKRFEEQVAKRYSDPSAKRPGIAGGDAEDESGNRGAAILIKGQRYCALVRLGHRQKTQAAELGMFAQDGIQFLNWVDADMAGSLPSGDLLFVDQKQVSKLPSGDPPETSKHDTGTQTEAI